MAVFCRATRFQVGVICFYFSLQASRKVCKLPIERFLCKFRRGYFYYITRSETFKIVHEIFLTRKYNNCTSTSAEAVFCRATRFQVGVICFYFSLQASKKVCKLPIKRFLCKFRRGYFYYIAHSETLIVHEIFLTRKYNNCTTTSADAVYFYNYHFIDEKYWKV